MTTKKKKTRKDEAMTKPVNTPAPEASEEPDVPGNGESNEDTLEETNDNNPEDHLKEVTVEEKAEEKGDELPKVPFVIFERVVGVKWDQLAGFKQYAKSRKLGPMSIPKWKNTYQEFLVKPMV